MRCHATVMFRNTAIPQRGAPRRHLNSHGAVVHRREGAACPLVPHRRRSATLPTALRAYDAARAPLTCVMPSRQRLAPSRRWFTPSRRHIAPSGVPPTCPISQQCASRPTDAPCAPSPRPARVSSGAGRVPHDLFAPHIPSQCPINAPYAVAPPAPPCAP
ncbi:hypothetical protein DENSPDRAFT_882493 [Dentipellis sp. KUC8613]|nr:hypothetical protein DENSPDRAFT_882493 [Dentipellis sp. KUC8613]